jgi:hypothetical protein
MNRRQRCLLKFSSFPGQTNVGGDSKIPSIIFYEQKGKVAAIGAEALLAKNLEAAEDEGWVKVEWLECFQSVFSAAYSESSQV